MEHPGVRVCDLNGKFAASYDMCCLCHHRLVAAKVGFAEVGCRNRNTLLGFWSLSTFVLFVIIVVDVLERIDLSKLILT